jgi:hypothetical protein
MADPNDAVSNNRWISMNPPVFITSAVLTLALVIFATLFTDAAASMFSFGRLYVLAVAGFIVFVVAVALSGYGRIKLGPDLQLRLVVRHAVLRRYGHRADVLRSGRTGDALRYPASRRTRDGGGRATGDLHAWAIYAVWPWPISQPSVLRSTR